MSVNCCAELVMSCHCCTIFQAHQIRQDFDDAAEAFQKVLSIEPTNKAAQSQLVQTRNKLKALREREKKRYANMFEKFAAASDGDKGQEEEPATK